MLGTQCIMLREEYETCDLDSLPDSWSPVTEAMYPKVKVHADSQQDAYFHQTNIQLQHALVPGGEIQTHLYFLLHHSLPDTTWEKLSACLHLLADEGIGGERSTGLGQVDSVSIHDASHFPQVSGAGTQVSIALCIPGSVNEFARFSHYQLIVRGGGSIGKRGNQLRHRSQIRMIQEGAVFSGSALGKLETLHREANRTVLRNGKNFSLPI
jgi:CRISPR-associated protein Csm4